MMQKFEPGFYVPSPKKVHLVDNTAVTIRYYPLTILLFHLNSKKEKEKEIRVEAESPFELYCFLMSASKP